MTVDVAAVIPRSRQTHLKRSPILFVQTMMAGAHAVSALGVLVLSVLLVTGCAQQPVAPAQPVVPAPTAPPPAQDFEPDILPLRAATTSPEMLQADPLYRILVAEFAGQREQLSTAVEQYSELAKTTANVEIAERAAKIALYAENTAAALASADRWVALAPTNLQARQIAAAVHVRARQPEPAIQHLTYVLEHDRAPEGTKFKMIANLLGREEDKETALIVMERLLDKKVKDPDTLLVYAVLALRAEKLEASRNAMDELVGKAAINPNIALAYVSALQRQQQVPEAINFLERALKRTPDEFGLRLLYARMLADADRFDDALAQFTRLNKQAPDNTDVIFALGLLNLQTRKLDAASARFMELKTFPERADDAHFYLGQIAEDRKQTAKALAAYREVKTGASLFQAQVRTAVLLASQKNVEEARTILAKLEPDNDEERRQAVLVEAEILAEQGDYANAMAVFDKALNGTYDTTLLYSRAMLAERMDRLDVLEADLREILKKEPDNTDALNALGYTLADRTKRYEEAHALIKRALTLIPDNFYVLDSMGWVLYRLGRLEEAIPYLQKARAQRDDPEVAAHLGEVLWALGRKEDAREVWESALESHPQDAKVLEAIKRLTQ